MSSFGITRDMLARVFGDDLRAIRAFEEQAKAVDDASSVSASTATATDALQDATVLVLSPNAAFANERVLRVDTRGLSIEDDGTHVTIKAKVENTERFRVRFSPIGDAVLFLPLSDTLVGRSSTDTLVNKTLDKPVVTNLGNYATDAAAATGGVPIGGLYHASGAVRIRLA